LRLVIAYAVLPLYPAFLALAGKMHTSSLASCRFPRWCRGPTVLA